MNWSSASGLLAALLVMIFAVLRVERRRLWAVIVLLVAPVVFLLWQWISFYRLWTEALAALVVAVVIAGTWWVAYGRRLPPPTSDNIKVWGQDAAPKPKPAELQAEVNRLREEKARLEEELRRVQQDRRRDGE